MKCTRLVLLAALWAPLSASAWTHGSAALVPGGQTVVNVPFGQYVNVIKGLSGICASGACGTFAWPAYLNADMYPRNVDIPIDIGGGFDNPFNTYYGHFNYSHVGCGSVSIGSHAIIYNGGVAVNGLQPTAGANSGSTAFTTDLRNKCDVGTTTPLLEFAYGGLINSIADNGSGKVRLGFTYAAANNFCQPSVGCTGTIQINSINGVTPAVYTYTNVGDNSHIDILGLSYNSGTMSVIGGAPGTASEGIFAPQRGGYGFLHGFTSAWTMSNALLCRTGDYALCSSGKMWNPDLIAQFKNELKPGFARFMDTSFVNGLGAVYGTIATNFTYRPKNSNLTFEPFSTGIWVPDYWVGTISNGGGDAYTASNPVASPSSVAYVDGEIVQGQIGTANAGNNPTLALSGRSGGAKPIFGSNYPGAAILYFGGIWTGSETINFTVTASYLSGGTRTIHYPLVSGDTNTNSLSFDFSSFLSSDATLAAANISSVQSNNVVPSTSAVIYNRNGQGVSPVAGATFSYTISNPGGSEALTIGTMPTPTQDTNNFESFSANQLVSLVYSKILDGWIPTQNGISQGASIEAMTQFCNDANVGCWINYPLLYSSASITSMVQTVAANLNSNLAYAPELQNEVWNTAFETTQYAEMIGVSLGFNGAGGGDVAFNSFYGLRFRQSQDLAKSAWAGAGRPVASLACTSGCLTGILADAEVNLANNPAFNDSLTYRLNGAALVTTNPTYNALAGLGGTAGTTYTAVGSRPVDDATVVSVAPYFNGTLIQQLVNLNGVPLSTYAPILQAGSDYASGNPTSMASALAVFDNDARSQLNQYPSPSYVNIQTIISGYDAQRAAFAPALAPLGRFDYEGFYDGSLSGNNNGTQDTGNDNTGYAPLSAAITDNIIHSGWNVSPYVSNNACGLVSNADIAACNVVTAYLAWKNSSLFQATTTAYLQQLVTAHPGRSVKGAMFGYTGQSVWEFFPGSIYFQHQKSYDAFANWP